MHPLFHGAFWLACVYLGDLCAQTTTPDQGASAESPSLSVTRDFFIPYTDLDHVLNESQEERGVFLPQHQIDEILNWVEEARAEDRAALGRPSIMVESASFSGRHVGAFCEFKLSLTLARKGLRETEDSREPDASWERLVLGSRELPIVECSTEGAYLAHAGEHTELWLSNAALDEVNLTLRYPVETTRAGEQLILGLPRLPGLQTQLEIPGEDWEIRTEPAEAIVRETADGVSRVRLTPGGRDALTIRWQTKRPTPGSHRSVRLETDVVIRGGSVEMRCQADLKIQRAPERSVAIQLPQGSQFLEWHAPENGVWSYEAGQLTVAFERPLMGAGKLAFSILLPSPDLPGNLAVQPCVFSNFHHQHGALHLWRSDEVAAGPLAVSNVYPTGKPRERDGLSWVGSFRYPRLPVDVEVPLSESRTILQVQSHTLWSLGAEAQEMKVEMHCDIAERPLHALKLAMPGGYEVTSVEGEGVAGHRLSGNELTVRFTSPRLGVAQITIQARDESEGSLPVQVEAPLLGVLGDVASVHDGRLAVLAEKDLEVAVRDPREMLLVDVGHALLASTNQGNNAPRYGFRYRGATTLPAILELDRRTPRVAATVEMRSQVLDHQLEHHWMGRFEVEDASIGELVLAVPKTLADAFRVDEVLLSAFEPLAPGGEPSLPADLADSHDRWKLVFRDRQLGEVRVEGSFVERLDASESAFSRVVPRIIPLEVDSLTGNLGVYASGSVEAVAEPGPDLEILDPSELSEPGAVEAFRFLDSNYQLALHLTRHQLFAVPRVLIPYAEMSVAMASDGGMTTALALFVKNRTERHLRLLLPNGATLAADVLVDGKAQPPRKDDEEQGLLVELPLKGDPVTVRLLYHLPVSYQKPGFIEIPPPQVRNGRVLRTVMNLHLPGSRRYRVAESAMHPVVDRGRGWARLRALSQALVPALGNQRREGRLSIVERPPDLRADRRQEWKAFKPAQSRHLQFHRLGTPERIVLRGYSTVLLNVLEAAAVLLTLALGLWVLIKRKRWLLPVGAGLALLVSGLTTGFLATVFQMMALTLIVLTVVAVLWYWRERLRLSRTPLARRAVHPAIS